MDPAIVLSTLSWWQKILLKLAIKSGLKRLNKLGKGYFTRQLAFDVRQQIITEIMRQIEWAKAKTPEFTVDEDALQCAAWVLESDTLQREFNAKTHQTIDVRARWGVKA
jgi:hypothetical protein